MKKQLIFILMFGMLAGCASTHKGKSAKKKNDCGCPTFSGQPQKKRR